MKNLPLFCSVCGEPREALSSGGRGACCKNAPLPSNAKRFCSFCGRQTDEEVTRSGRGKCCANVHINRGTKYASAIVDSCTPWVDDYSARAWVLHHPDGATLEEVGDAVGLTRERVRQVEAIAKNKLLRFCRHENVELLEILRCLQQRHEDATPSLNVRSDPFAGGPSEGLRTIKDALDARLREQHQEPDGRVGLAEEFYDEQNARAAALFNELDLEARADLLFKITSFAGKESA